MTVPPPRLPSYIARSVTRGGRPHAVVIGSGFGGLAAAVRLGARGFRVTVLERLDAPGGRAYVHHQDGFTFDAGPTIATAPFLLEELWGLCGRRFADEIELRLMDPFYRIRFDDGEHFDYSGDPQAIRAEIRRLAPGDLAGYERFIAKIETIFRVGFEQLGHVPFDNLWSMARIVPAMARLQSYRSVYSMVSSFIRGPRLRTILSFHPLLIGGNPFTVTSIYALISFLERRWRVHSAMGGTGTLVNGLVSLIEGQGNQIRYQAEVAEILVRDHQARGVRLADGEEIPADLVVSNADAAWTYRHLLPGASTGPATPAASSCGTSGPAGPIRMCSTTPSSWGPATGSSWRTFSTARSWRRTSASICTDPPPRTPPWHPAAAIPSMPWPRCRTWTARPTGRPRRSPIGLPSPPIWSRAWPPPG